MLKKVTSMLAAVALAAGTAGTITASADEPAMRDITTQEIVNEMGVGINLGNTFESCGVEQGIGQWNYNCTFETGWGSPKITKEMIEGYKAEGFSSLRIPVAWSNTFKKDDNTYTIDPAAMARVKEVAQWAVDSDLYVIINIHWDGGWWGDSFGTNKEEAMNRYTTMWDQICDGFADFDDHLIFESLNEEGGSWESHMTQDESYTVLNEVNQAFVDLVRSKGGNNAERHLLIAGYNTDIDRTCDERFIMPTDPLNRCAVSVHYYYPQGFALLNEDASWAKFRDTWGTEKDYAELNAKMDQLKKRFVDNGVPVIMGECGMGSEIKLKKDGEATKFMLAEIEAMRTRGICPVLWDINYTESNKQENIIYNRNKKQITDSKLKEGIAELSKLGVKKDSVIECEDSYTVKFLDPSFKIDAKSTSGAAVKFMSSDDTIASVDAEGNVTVGKSGTATITISADATDEYLPAIKEVTIVVEKLDQPPVMPDAVMKVDPSIKSTSQIELPEGWKWSKTYTLTEGETTVARAIYEDSNYKNRSLDIEISYKTESDTDSSSNAESSVDSNSSATSSTTSAASSSSSTSSKAATTSAATSTVVKNGDQSPTTGVGASAAGLVIALSAAAMVVRKKSK